MPKSRGKGFWLVGALLALSAVVLAFSLFMSGGAEKAKEKESIQAAETSAQTKPEAAAEEPAAAGTGKGGALQGPNNPAEIESLIDSFFDRPAVQSRLQNAGVVVTVVGNGTELLSKGYGYADIESRTPVNADRTLFRMASVTKTVTAAAVMQLVDQGKIDLNENVETYLNGLKIPNRTGVPLTVGNLLTHTTGFDYPETPVAASDPAHAHKLGDYVQRYMPTVVKTPGTVYHYDNFAYDLLGYLVEQVTGMPYEQAVARHIFEPLGIARSVFEMDKTQDQLVTGYDSSMRKSAPYSMDPVISPTGGLLATGSDMGRFMLGMLEGKSSDGAPILSEASLAGMRTTQFRFSEEMPVATYGFAYGLRALDNGQNVISKGGNLHDCASYLWLLPEKGVGLFVATNNASYDPSTELIREFMNHYYPKSENAQVSPDVAKSSSVDLEAYAGIYRNLRIPTQYSTVDVSNGRLELQNSGKASFWLRLTPIGNDIFLDRNGDRVGIRLGEDGKGRYIYMEGENSWLERLPDYAPYSDVAADDPYADAIRTVRLMGLSPAETADQFEPDRPVTRGEFAAQIGKLSLYPPSKAPASFEDTQNDPDRQWIQLLADLGAFGDSPSGLYRPQEAITREEAAQILYVLAGKQNGAAVDLTEPPSAEAADAVAFVIRSGLYGPEVKQDASGRYDYRPFDPLLRREDAVWMIKANDFYLNK